jgi:glutamyl-tRNA synthetase
MHAKPIAKVMKGDAFDLLAELRERLAGLDEQHFGERAHEQIKSLAEEKHIGMGKVAQPLRVAVSGSTVTPPIDATLEILGPASTLARIDHCLAARTRRSESS